MSTTAHKPEAEPRVLDRYVRQREVLALLGVSRVTLYQWRKRGWFPAPVLIGPNLFGWQSSTIREWMANRLEGGTAWQATRPAGGRRKQHADAKAA